MAETHTSRATDPEALRDEVERAIQEGEALSLRDLVVRVGHEAEDARWAEVICVRLAKHRNAMVRGDALAALGHLARRFGSLDRRRCQRVVETALHAHHEYVREQAASAADDLETYLAWRIDRPGTA
jgi:hypothetical protein